MTRHSKMNEQPRVSIITTSYNSVETILDTVVSVARQSHPSIEHIIIDGGSTDGTLEVLRRNQKTISVLVSEPDNGVYDAMNKGIEVATGDIVGFLNSDDFYANRSVIADIVKQFQLKGVDAVFGDLVMVSREDIRREVRYYCSSNFKPEKFEYGWMPAHPTFFAKRESYEKYGMYKTDYLISADYELLVRFLAKNKVSYSYLNKVIVKMRLGGISTRSWKNKWVLNKEIVRACKENGIHTNIMKLMLKIPKKMLEYRGMFLGRRVTGN